jgi:toxin ParE1/3/4
VTVKRLALRELACRDVEDAIDFYLAEAGEAVALAFIDALEAAYGAMAAQPGAGSPRHGQALDLPGLRRWRIRGFPYLVFYVERDAEIDVWRVLHGSRDIPAWLQEA